MSVIRVVYAALLLIFTIWSTTIHCQVTRSRKKGLVIPYWPRHMCGDFDAFETVSWWYNYHTYKQVYDQVPYWCTCEDGFPPKNKSICFPSDPHEIAFVPQGLIIILFKPVYESYFFIFSPNNKYSIWIYICKINHLLYYVALPECSECYHPQKNLN